MLEHAQLEAVYIYFDTATYDEIERDEKVMMSVESTNDGVDVMLILEQCQGHNGGPIGLDRRHDGASHGLLNFKWSRDRLLPRQVSLVVFDTSSIPQVLHVTHE